MERHTPIKYREGGDGSKSQSKKYVSTTLFPPPDESKGSTLDPDMVAHEHRSFFFSDNGHGAANAANAAGFGWRNGG
jgi:subtilisin family serine protease